MTSNDKVKLADEILALKPGHGARTFYYQELVALQAIITEWKQHQLEKERLERFKEMAVPH